MPREEEDEKGEAKAEEKMPRETEGTREAEESKETEAQVPREEESKKVGNTEAKARPRGGPLVPLLLTPFALEEPSDQQWAQTSPDIVCSRALCRECCVGTMSSKEKGVGEGGSRGCGRSQRASLQHAKLARFSK